MGGIAHYLASSSMARLTVGGSWNAESTENNCSKKNCCGSNYKKKNVYFSGRCFFLFTVYFSNKTIITFFSSVLFSIRTTVWVSSAIPRDRYPEGGTSGFSAAPTRQLPTTLHLLQSLLWPQCRLSTSVLFQSPSL